MNSKGLTYETREDPNRDDGYCPTLPGFPKIPSLYQVRSRIRHPNLKWIFAKYNLNRSNWERKNGVPESAQVLIPAGLSPEHLYMPPDSWLAGTQIGTDIYSVREEDKHYILHEDLRAAMGAIHVSASTRMENASRNMHPGPNITQPPSARAVRSSPVPLTQSTRLPGLATFDIPSPRKKAWYLHNTYAQYDIESLTNREKLSLKDHETPRGPPQFATHGRGDAPRHSAIDASSAKPVSGTPRQPKESNKLVTKQFASDDKLDGSWREPMLGVSLPANLLGEPRQDHDRGSSSGDSSFQKPGDIDSDSNSYSEDLDQDSARMIVSTKTEISGQPSPPQLSSVEAPLQESGKKKPSGISKSSTVVDREGANTSLLSKVGDKTSGKPPRKETKKTWETRKKSKTGDGNDYCPALVGGNIPKGRPRLPETIKQLFRRYNRDRSRWEENNGKLIINFSIPPNVDPDALYIPPPEFPIKSVLGQWQEEDKKGSKIFTSDELIQAMAQQRSSNGTVSFGRQLEFQSTPVNQSTGGRSPSVKVENELGQTPVREFDTFIDKAPESQSTPNQQLALGENEPTIKIEHNKYQIPSVPQRFPNNTNTKIKVENGGHRNTSGQKRKYKEIIEILSDSEDNGNPVVPQQPRPTPQARWSVRTARQEAVDHSERLQARQRPRDSGSSSRSPGPRQRKLPRVGSMTSKYIDINQRDGIARIETTGQTIHPYGHSLSFSSEAKRYRLENGSSEHYHSLGGPRLLNDRSVSTGDQLDSQNRSLGSRERLNSPLSPQPQPHGRSISSSLFMPAVPRLQETPSGTGQNSRVGLTQRPYREEYAGLRSRRPLLPRPLSLRPLSPRAQEQDQRVLLPPDPKQLSRSRSVRRASGSISPRIVASRSTTARRHDQVRQRSETSDDEDPVRGLHSRHAEEKRYYRNKVAPKALRHPGQKRVLNRPSNTMFEAAEEDENNDDGEEEEEDDEASSDSDTPVEVDEHGNVRETYVKRNLRSSKPYFCPAFPTWEPKIAFDSKPLRAGQVVDLAKSSRKSWEKQKNIAQESRKKFPGYFHNGIQNLSFYVPPEEWFAVKDNRFRENFRPPLDQPHITWLEWRHFIADLERGSKSKASSSIIKPRTKVLAVPHGEIQAASGKKRKPMAKESRREDDGIDGNDEDDEDDEDKEHAPIGFFFGS